MGDVIASMGVARSAERALAVTVVADRMWRRPEQRRERVNGESAQASRDPLTHSKLLYSAPPAGEEIPLPGSHALDIGRRLRTLPEPASYPHCSIAA